MVIIVIILVLVGIGVVLGAVGAAKEDKLKTESKEMVGKFSVLIRKLNEWAYQGQGRLYPLGNQKYKLYKEDSCQIIIFSYANDILTNTQYL